MIPIFSPVPQYEALKPSIDKALIDVAASGAYILGPQVTQFEADFAKAMGTPYSVGVNSGTDALLLALRALDIGPGDEVITTPFSYVATSEVIVRVGARPVFVDIDPDTFNLNLDLVEQAITPETKAIIPVHLFGLAVDMTRLMAIAQKHNLVVIEDCAQAAGATWQGKPVGSFGHAGAFSFFPTKNLGALGDGGAITTHNEALAERLKSLRVHGCTPSNKYDHQESGVNSRLDALQAAALLVKLPYLAQWNEERRRIAQYYTSQIQQSDLAKFVTPPKTSSEPTSLHAFHQYTVKLATDNPDVRQQVQTRLSELGVMAMIYYPIPLHLQKTHSSLGYQRGAFSMTEKVSNQVLSLPIYPGLKTSEQDTVIDALKQAVLNSVLAV